MCGWSEWVVLLPEAEVVVVWTGHRYNPDRFDWGQSRLLLLLLLARSDSAVGRRSSKLHCVLVNHHTRCSRSKRIHANIVESSTSPTEVVPKMTCRFDLLEIALVRGKHWHLVIREERLSWLLVVVHHHHRRFH